MRRRAPVHRPGGQGHRLPGRRLRRLRVPARPRLRRPGALPARGLGRRSGASGVGARAARDRLRDQAAARRPHDRARGRGRGAVRLGGGRQRRSLPRAGAAGPGGRGRDRDGAAPGGQGLRARGRRHQPSTPGSASRRSPAPPRRSREASIPPPGGASRPARGRRARGSTTGPAGAGRPRGAEYDDRLAGPWTRGLPVRRSLADGELAFFSTWCPAGTAVDDPGQGRGAALGDRGRLRDRRDRARAGPQRDPELARLAPPRLARHARLRDAGGRSASRRTRRRPRKTWIGLARARRPHPLVGPGAPPRRCPPRAATHPTRPRDRLVALATRPPGRRPTLPPEAETQL